MDLIIHISARIAASAFAILDEEENKSDEVVSRPKIISPLLPENFS